jgi:hypothetical protein
MQFHEYLTIQRCLLKYGTSEEFKQRLRRMTPEQARVMILVAVKDGCMGPCSADMNIKRMGWATAEQSWAELLRPYYNVWPIAVDLCKQVRLELRFDSFKIPYNTLVLRFAKGHEPYGLETAMLDWHEQRIQITGRIAENTLHLEERYSPDTQVEEWLKNIESQFTEYAAISCLLVKLVVFVGLLSHDQDVITPIVLSKDQAKYNTAKTPDEKKWLEDRAARRVGRGFDVCRKLELDRSSSPHWRNPHLCLFWTGAGRTIPIIKMRSGAIIQKVSMADVPTGYLGPEAEDEVTTTDEKTPSESMPKSRRFDIMKRDGFKCQLCGTSQEQGAVLHVDHKVPLANGGSNEDENLWTLCEPCNLGKSTKTL